MKGFLWRFENTGQEVGIKRRFVLGTELLHALEELNDDLAGRADKHLGKRVVCQGSSDNES